MCCVPNFGGEKAQIWARGGGGETSGNGGYARVISASQDPTITSDRDVTQYGKREEKGTQTTTNLEKPKIKREMEPWGGTPVQTGVP